MKSPSEARDTGTPELAKRRSIQPRLVQGHYDLYVVDGSGADRLLLAGTIDTVQHASLLAFTVLLHKAQMLGPKSPATERVTNSDPSQISDKVAEAMKKVAVVINQLDKKVGRKTREDVVNLCMLDRDVSDRTSLADAIDALRSGLDIAYAR